MDSNAGYTPTKGQVVLQPVSSQPQGTGSHVNLVIQQGESAWSSGLLDCCEDPLGCAAAWFCYPFYMCYLANKVGEACIVPCCVPGSMVTLRSMNRVQHNIPGSVMGDCCTTCWCPCCAVTQLSRHHDFTTRHSMTTVITR